MTASAEQRLAILIDADNISATLVGEIFKAAYGMGGPKTPASFRNACTKFFELHMESTRGAAGNSRPSAAMCPRCGGKLAVGWTKSNFKCFTCASCGGMSSKIDALKKAISSESMAEMISAAQKHEQPGCVCPSCGSSMSLLKVSSGNKHIDIDVCAKCRAIWYDKGEFEALTPQDGVLQAMVSAGKAYRRETVIAVSADLRSGRLKALDLKALNAILCTTYHVPTPDVAPVIGALQCQRKIKVDSKNGKITVVQLKDR